MCMRVCVCVCVCACIDCKNEIKKIKKTKYKAFVATENAIEFTLSLALYVDVRFSVV